VSATWTLQVPVVDGADFVKLQATAYLSPGVLELQELAQDIKPLALINPDMDVSDLHTVPVTLL
jgi:hypothetical protein